jgi:alpha-tubulin suppressor-like RCC1 family protein
MRIALRASALAAPLLLACALTSCAPPAKGSHRTTALAPTAAIAVAAGDYHTCALLENSTVTCWGQNEFGQLGDPSTEGGTTVNPGGSGAFPTPTVVAGLTGVSQIATGSYFTCALLKGGTVSCWGDNQYGELGNPTGIGTYNPTATPTPVAALSGVAQIAAGGDHTCALMTDGTVTCWGWNDHGELGNTTNVETDNGNPSPTGVDLSAFTQNGVHVTQITAGVDHTCALLSDSTVACWGNNYYGELGNPNNTEINQTSISNPTPAAVVGLNGVNRVTAGQYNTCAVMTDGTIRCWGQNNFGELGNGDTTGFVHSVPTQVGALLTSAKQVAGGYTHTCAVLTDNTVACWGENYLGELGYGTSAFDQTKHPTPVVLGLMGVSQVTAGDYHTCVVLTNGTVDCWGDNYYGQSGNVTNVGNRVSNPAPAEVPGIP